MEHIEFAPLITSSFLEGNIRLIQHYWLEQTNNPYFITLLTKL